MPVIKEFESRVEDIRKLERLIEETSHDPKLRKRIEIDLIKLRTGEKAEKNASYMLGEIYRDMPVSYLINGLRLDIDGEIAQIDHITINSIGVVNLIETKSISTGLKVSEKGIFSRWDNFKKQYIDIPSPIQQSKRHERVLRKALEKIGYKPELIQHFVVVDYKAKLIKPDHGYDNVCRPDMIEQSIERSLQQTNIVKAFKIVGKMVSGACYNKLQIRLYAEKLAFLHTPISFDYRAYYGIDEKQKKLDEVVISKTPSCEVTKDKLTFSKFAEKEGMKTKDLEELLISKNYLERKEKGMYLTDKAKVAGFEVKRGRYGFYFLVPSNFTFE